jgi:hypothetical protein
VIASCYETNKTQLAKPHKPHRAHQNKLATPKHNKNKPGASLVDDPVQRLKKTQPHAVYASAQTCQTIETQQAKQLLANDTEPAQKFHTAPPTRLVSTQKRILTAKENYPKSKPQTTCPTQQKKHTHIDYSSLLSCSRNYHKRKHDDNCRIAKAKKPYLTSKQIYQNGEPLRLKKSSSKLSTSLSTIQSPKYLQLYLIHTNSHLCKPMK